MLSYLANPDATEFREFSLHLAGCGECRSQLGTLSTLREGLDDLNSESYQQIIERDTELDEALQQQLIERYVDDQLPGEEKQQIASLLQKNPQGLKAALHYASHSSSMQRALPEFSNTTPVDQAGLSQGQKRQSRLHKSTLLNRLKYWFSLQTRIWISVPVTAAAAAVLAIIFMPASGTLTIAMYQDNPVIQFEQKNELPGIGFFSTARKVVKPFERVTIELVEKDTIALSWLAVEGAESYTVSLQKFALGQKIKLGENTTITPRVEFKDLNIDLDHRYEWILTGKTTDAKTFYTSGGFVIARND
ncbi:hypothetical protein MNBD_GAMMA21-2744 [hydrothermal vent metagenome]|uniref:Zinc-finger domain-containing protein n=1 Tax=hydrothermal vent metagenome TaxID=652676 RepID=A0A3B1B2R4_9ZZZZ